MKDDIKLMKDIEHAIGHFEEEHLSSIAKGMKEMSLAVKEVQIAVAVCYTG